MEMQRVIVDGGIGAGKSELVVGRGAAALRDVLRERWSNIRSIECVGEPLHRMKSFGASQQDMFGCFLEDESRGAFLFQMSAWLSRLQEQEQTCQLAVFERYLHSDALFAIIQFLLGNISAREMTVYVAVYAHMVSLLEPVPTLYVLLDTDVKTARERIIVRGRPGENKTYTDAYLDMLIRAHKMLYEGRLEDDYRSLYEETKQTVRTRRARARAPLTRGRAQEFRDIERLIQLLPNIKDSCVVLDARVSLEHGDDYAAFLSALAKHE